MSSEQFPRRSGLIDLSAFADDEESYFFMRIRKKGTNKKQVVAIPQMNGDRYLDYKHRTGRDLMTDVQLVTRIINYVSSESSIVTEIKFNEAQIMRLEQLLETDLQVVEEMQLSKEDRAKIDDALKNMEFQVDQGNTKLNSLQEMSRVTPMVSDQDYPFYQVGNIGVLRAPLTERCVDIILQILAKSYWVDNPEEDTEEKYVVTAEPENEVGIADARKIPVIGKLFKAGIMNSKKEVTNVFYEIIVATELLDRSEQSKEEEDDPKN